MSNIKVSIIGGAGYGAAELLRHLLVRDDVEVIRVSSKDFIGDRVDTVHRTLGGLTDLILEDLPPKEAATGADFVFLAMPHKITAAVAMELFDLDVRIIDLSGDFRLRSLVDYQRDYAPNHPCPERLGTFAYGLPELNRKAIAKAQHVASPGCFATCITLGLLPLAKAGLLQSDQGLSVRTVAMTGSSGSGVRPSAGTHHPVRSRNLKPYKVLHHQHRAEILQTLGDAGAKNVALDFIPVSAPLARGILAISQLDLPTSLDADSAQQLFEDTYRDFRLVRMMPKGQVPEVAAVAGTGKVEVGVQVRIDEHTGVKTLACMSAIDNLIKGGAGQAIQCFNLMTGHSEFYGLDAPGMWP
ncbi:MAG: N-acetyl-gamma-glutamyl-phosphate reductase [Deltaproteobacteria bacterium]|nr:N-acetyl-gamma-glutamyl-phosphate reductase [Deltaproteobacteria bacterium]